MSQRYEIPASKLPLIQKRINRATKRNPVHGLPTPTMTILDTYQKTVEIHDPLARIRGSNKDTRSVTIPAVVIEVDGYSANFGEWDIVGYRYKRYNRNDDQYRGISNTGEVPDDLAKQPICCSHCKTNRSRSSSYIVQKVADEDNVVEVGSTCLAAFLGQSITEGYVSGLAQNATILREIQIIADTGFADSDDDILDEIQTILAVAHSVIEREGFLSSRQAYDVATPTWRIVNDEVRRYRNPDLDDSDIDVSLSNFIVAKQIIDWCQSDTFNLKENDFLRTCHRIVSDGITSVRDIAPLTALVNSYQQHLQHEAKREKATAIVAESSHVGVEKERGDYICAVKSIRGFQTRFGDGDVITMLDANSNLLVWFASKKDHGLETGRTYAITGTVKEHTRAKAGLYEGSKQTTLTRLTVNQDLGETIEHVVESSEKEQERDDFLSILSGMN